MKKSLLAVFCLFIALFAFTSCNNDVKSPTGNNSDNESNTNDVKQKVVGIWIEDKDSQTKDTIELTSEGKLIYTSSSGHKTELSYSITDKYIYNVEDISSTNDFIYSLDLNNKVLNVYNGDKAHPFIYESGTPVSIIGTWTGKIDGAAEGERKDVITITETDFTRKYYLNGKLETQIVCKCSKDGDNTLKVESGKGYILVGEYDNTNDKVIFYEDGTFSRSK